MNNVLVNECKQVLVTAIKTVDIYKNDSQWYFMAHQAKVNPLKISEVLLENNLDFKVYEHHLMSGYWIFSFNQDKNSLWSNGVEVPSIGRLAADI